MIKIGHKVYNTLAVQLQKHRDNEKRKRYGDARFPWLFLVGSKEPNGIIDIICRVKENTDKLLPIEAYRKIERCYRMSNLNAKEFIYHAIKIMKRGYTVWGLVRVGEFTRQGLHHNDGNAETDLRVMNPDALFITVQPSGINVRQKYKDKEYKIVRQK